MQGSFVYERDSLWTRAQRAGWRLEYCNQHVDLPQSPSRQIGRTPITANQEIFMDFRYTKRALREGSASITGPAVKTYLYIDHEPIGMCFCFSVL